MVPTTAHPTKQDPYVCYRYSGSRKKVFVTIHNQKVNKVSEGLVDYYLVLVEKPGKIAIEAKRLPFEEVQFELPKVDKKTAHNLLYGESLDGLQEPSKPNTIIWYSYPNKDKRRLMGKKAWVFLLRETKQTENRHPCGITQKEDHYEVLTDVSSEAKKDYIVDGKPETKTRTPKLVNP